MYQSDDLNSIPESHQVAGENVLKLYTHSGTLWHHCACSNTYHTHKINKINLKNLKSSLACDIWIRKERENINFYAQYRDSTPKFSTRHVTKFQFQRDHNSRETYNSHRREEEH